MLAYHPKVHCETILCLCIVSCKFQSAEPRRNIYRAKTRDVEVFRVDSTNIEPFWQQEIKHTVAKPGYRIKHTYLHNLFPHSRSHNTAPIGRRVIRKIKAWSVC